MKVCIVLFAGKMDQQTTRACVLLTWYHTQVRLKTLFLRLGKKEMLNTHYFEQCVNKCGVVICVAII